MNLYLLSPKPNHPAWFDKAFGFVVRATDPQAARTLASAQYGNEGPAVWLDSNISTCELLTVRGESEVILRGFASK